MSARLKPYPAYKDSGVELFPQVPEHWEVRRLGAIGRLFKGNGGTKEDEAPTGVPCVRYGDIYMHHRFFVRESRSCVSVERVSDYTPIRYGDVLFAGSGETIEEIGKSVACLIESSACCGGDVVVFRPSIELDARFMGYATDSRQAVTQKSRIGRGITVMHIYSDQLKNLRLALPSLPEQAAIVRCLDYMDRRIRRYIRAKQKLIKLLEEQRQIIIHQAITGQTDVRTGRPYPAYKDSGVPWIGTIPSHWAIQKLKYLTKLSNGIAFKPSDWGDDGTPIIRIQNLNGSEVFNFTVRSDLPDDLLVRPGDLLFSWSGNRGTSFGSFIWDRDFSGYLNQHIFKLHGYALDRSYFAYLLRAVTRHVEQEHTHGIIGLVHVTKPQFGGVVVPAAPPEEQTAIADFICKQLCKLDKVRSQAIEGVNFVRDYRTRFIADVVTGKLDVRKAVTNLADEGEEPVVDENMLADERDLNEVVQEEAAREEVEV